MNAATMGQRVLACAEAIRKAERSYEVAIERHADAERAYKRGEALALTKVTDWKNSEDRRAKAELIDGMNLGDLRHAAHLAEGLKDAAKLAVRNRNQELSALQSQASLAKEEARFLSGAPQEAIGA